MLYSGLKAFINARIAEHPQIAEWLSDWSPAHETQINVDFSGLVQSGKHWFDSEGYEVRPIRIPFDSMGSPYHRDQKLIGPVHRHWHTIGTTGWNWQQLRSEWVGFDFDSLHGHARGLTPEQLQEIRQRAMDLKYVTARTSTGGNGLHLLVPVRATTRNHREHASLAREVLYRMSIDCDFSFHTNIDCCGSVLWHWRKGLSNESLKRIS